MSAAASADDLAALLRRVIDRLRLDRDGLFAEVDAAVVAGQPTTVTGDPVLLGAIRATIRSNILCWADAVYDDPFAPVAPNDSLEAVAVAAEFRHRGLADESVAAFRDGQAAAWERWVELGSAVISDPRDLSAFLTHSARSIFAYIDATTAAITDRLDRRSAVADPAGRRRERALEILGSDPVDAEELEGALGYRFDQHHLAVVLWTQGLDGAGAVLDAAVADLVGALGGRPVLEVPNGVATRWLWIAGSPAPAFREVAAAVQGLPTLRLAAGVAASGIDGFRASHTDALAAQRVIAASKSRRTGTWAELELVALLMRDPAGARRFTERTLGRFLGADADLRETVKVYLQLGANATRTSQVLFTHRNTVIDRVKRAEALLPRPLAADRLNVACALELSDWIG